MSLLLNRNDFGDTANTGNVLSKDEADQLLNDWVLNDKLRTHMKQVAHLMRSWAAEREHLREDDQWRWEMAGLLHDADWDQWPELHCKKIIEELEQEILIPKSFMLLPPTDQIISVWHLKLTWIKCCMLLMNFLV